MAHSPVSHAGSSRESDALQYEPSSHVLVRAPLLPLSAYANLATAEGRAALLSDPRVRRALAVGSNSLLSAMERHESGGLSPRDLGRMHSRVLRYLIRMSTRPTPFGHFAGVSLAPLRETTTLAIQSTCAHTRTRPDMAWLMELVLPAEKTGCLGKHLRLRTNSMAFVRGGRVWLSQARPDAPAGQPSSIRATPVVLLAIEAARSAIGYPELAAEIMRGSKSATPEKVDGLLTQLIEQTFLLTDLRPPMTADDPAEYVAQRLAAIPDGAAVLGKLQALLDRARDFDRAPACQGVAAFCAILEQANVPADGSQESPVQTDMAMAVDGGLGAAVAREAAKAAQLLLRLTPMPAGFPALAAYRQAYLDRYGGDREVPLLELVDPHLGLGPSPMRGHGPDGRDPARAARRAEALFQLACRALYHREPVVELDEKLLSSLEAWKPDPSAAPPSLDLNFLIAAKSAGAVDAGDFLLVVGPNLGASAAGRNLGRFATLIGPEARGLLQSIAAAEEARAGDTLNVELVYLPDRFRSANVVIRPAIRRWEIAIGASPGVPDEFVVPMRDLVIGLDRGRFYARWPAAGKCIRVCSGHMLNPQSAPAAARLLLEIAEDGLACFNGFSWDAAESFPRLPRVQAGRIVLRPAQWQANRNSFEPGPPSRFAEAVRRWRAEWEIPRYVCLTFSDNRLILDLEDEAQASEIRTELDKLPEGGSLIFQEVVPGLEEAWLEGPGGRYYSEFILPMVLHGPADTAPRSPRGRGDEPPPQSPTPSERSRENTAEPILLSDRLQPPGGEWLFLKLYVRPDLANDIIQGSLRSFTENAVRAELTDGWFFIRYADPDPHLRIRFHGEPERLTGPFFQQLCAWANDLVQEGICSRVAFDTYDRELERYGGTAAAGAAEKIFAADSRAFTELLPFTSPKSGWPHDRITLLAVTVDDLLAALGYDERDRLDWYRGRSDKGAREVGDDYRRRKDLLRQAAGNPEWLRSQPAGHEIAEILSRRRAAIEPARVLLRDLEKGAGLHPPLDTLCRSFVHLHFNRLCGPDAGDEQRVLSLLLRAHESVARAPVKG